MNYPQIMSPLSPLPQKVGVMSPSSYGSAAHVCTKHWKIYYIYPQSGCTTRYARHHSVARQFAAVKICRQTQIDRQIDRERITENNGCIAAPANSRQCTFGFNQHCTFSTLRPQVGIQPTLNDRKQVLFSGSFVRSDATIKPSHGSAHHRLTVSKQETMNCLKLPEYLTEFCIPASNKSSRYCLQSAGSTPLAVPSVNLSTYGRRAFSITGPIT